MVPQLYTIWDAMPARCPVNCDGTGERIGPRWAVVLVFLVFFPVTCFWQMAGAPAAELHERLPRHDGTVYSIAFSPKGHFLVTAGEDQQLRIHPLIGTTSDRVAVSKYDQLLRELDADQFQVRQAAYEQLLKAGPEIAEQLERVSDTTESGEVRARVQRLLQRHSRPSGVGHQRHIRDTVISPDGQTIATVGHDNTLRFWEASSGLMIASRKVHSNGAWSVAFAPDGSQIATGGGDQSVQLWDTSTRRRRQTLSGHGSTVHALAYSPDGRILASAGGFDRSVFLWDATTGRRLFRWHPGPEAVLCVAFHPDGKRGRLAAGGYGGTVSLLDVKTQQKVRTFDTGWGVVRSIAFSPHGDWIAMGGKSESVRVIRFDDGAVVHDLPGHDGSVYDVSFSPDGRLLATADGSGEVRLWSIRISQQLETHSFDE